MILTTERLRTMRDHFRGRTDEVSAVLTLALNELLEYREAEEQFANENKPRTGLEIECGGKKVRVM